ncbi:hypothetical protein HMPREF0991_00002 [Lachnospiraceae bacterium 2_1_58FAA]|uniref:hypothetical protein n=1 Tax=Mediterraneibacter gnavus TaxID=33038 RepID=UPI0002137411|nr:hypothetical protein [Mediterraneibacter gnavus]EGN49668.1 hypothetical protein HMPREF0991_00002 [Lachnospiraceae bacterium 2_1_58FAA]
MSKELTTEQKIMQATQYGLLIYAGQRKIYDEDERLKLEKIANEIGEYWGLEEPVAVKCYNKVVTEVANKI